jgi:hypothetical protein
VFKHWMVTIGLLLAILLIGSKIVQRALPPAAAPPVSFTCAVAVNHQVGEVCVKGASGAVVTVEIDYCDGSRVRSPAIRTQIEGEYRWVWQVNTSCSGQARALAHARWPWNTWSEAIATFDVASPHR